MNCGDPVTLVSKTACRAIVWSACLWAAVSVTAQPDPLDLGAPDSLFVVLSQPQLGFDDTTLTAELYLSNDAQPIVGLVIGLEWDNEGLHLDSARLSPAMDPLAGFFQFLYYKNDLDSSNAAGRCQCVLMSDPGVQLTALDQPRLAATYYFQLTGWAAGDNICVDRATFASLSMVDTDAGEYAVTWSGAACREAGEDVDADGRGDLWDNCPIAYNPDQADLDDDGLGNVCDPDADGDGWTDDIDNCLLLYNPGQEDADGDGVGDPCDHSCCVGRVGDANDSGDDEPTIGDISALVSMLFLTQQPLSCLTEADTNQSGGAVPTAEDITIGDISVLIDYLFITGPELVLNDCL